MAQINNVNDFKDVFAPSTMGTAEQQSYNAVRNFNNGNIATGLGNVIGMVGAGAGAVPEIVGRAAGQVGSAVLGGLSNVGSGIAGNTGDQPAATPNPQATLKSVQQPAATPQTGPNYGSISVPAVQGSAPAAQAPTSVVADMAQNPAMNGADGNRPIIPNQQFTNNLNAIRNWQAQPAALNGAQKMTLSDPTGKHTANDVEAAKRAFNADMDAQRMRHMDSQANYLANLAANGKIDPKVAESYANLYSSVLGHQSQAASAQMGHQMSLQQALQTHQMDNAARLQETGLTNASRYQLGMDEINARNRQEQDKIAAEYPFKMSLADLQKAQAQKAIADAGGELKPDPTNPDIMFNNQTGQRVYTGNDPKMAEIERKKGSKVLLPSSATK